MQANALEEDKFYLVNGERMKFVKLKKTKVGASGYGYSYYTTKLVFENKLGKKIEKDSGHGVKECKDQGPIIPENMPEIKKVSLTDLPEHANYKEIDANGVALVTFLSLCGVESNLIDVEYNSAKAPGLVIYPDQFKAAHEVISKVFTNKFSS